MSPRLTKKRVELVPWSTAPTNGPKTAFFAAAMEVSQLQVGEFNTTGLRGDCGGRSRESRGWSSALLLEARARLLGSPFTRARQRRPAPPAQAPPRPAFPEAWWGEVAKGALSSRTANEEPQKETGRQASLGQCDVKGAGFALRRGRGGSARWVTWLWAGEASALSRAEAERGRRRTLPIGREHPQNTPRRRGPEASAGRSHPKCRTACSFSGRLCRSRSESPTDDPVLSFPRFPRPARSAPVNDNKHLYRDQFRVPPAAGASRILHLCKLGTRNAEVISA